MFVGRHLTEFVLLCTSHRHMCYLGLELFGMTSKSGKNVKDSISHHARVFLRCRPVLQGEQHCRTLTDIVGDKQLSVRNGSSPEHTYHFDRVFGPMHKQIDIYRSVVEPCITDVLAGFNCSVLAYGQAGSGKTFTMEGNLEADASAVFDPESKAGLIPLTMSGLLHELNKVSIDFSMRISFLMLYNEELYDLLSTDETPSKLRLFDDAAKKRGVIISGLEEKSVLTYSQVLAELKKATERRQALATQMNMNSSQCHSIFSVTVYTLESCCESDDLLKTGRLCFVDLAASESIARSGSTDKSITALGRVTTCLVEHQAHIPYRESKLTRILQDSLGGRAKTSIIATISLTETNFEDLKSTLDYAHRAKRLSNHPEVNQKMSKTVLNKEYKNVINDLKRKLETDQKSKGFYIANENYQKLKLDIEEQQTVLTTKVEEIKAYAMEIKKLEENFKVLSKDIDKSTKQLENGVKTLEKTIEKVGVAGKELAEVQTDNKQVKELLDIVTEHGEELENQVAEVISIAVETSQYTGKIYEKLEHCKTVVQVNNDNLAYFMDQFCLVKNSLLRKREKFVGVFSCLDDLQLKLENELKISSRESDAVMGFLYTLCDKIISSSKSFDATCDKAMASYQDWEKETQNFVNGHLPNVIQLLRGGQRDFEGLCTSCEDSIASVHQSTGVAIACQKEEMEKKEHSLISAIQAMTSVHSGTLNNCFQATASQVQEHSNKVSTHEPNFVGMSKSTMQGLNELQTEISSLVLKWEETAEKKVSNDTEHEQMFMDEQDFLNNNVSVKLCELESKLQMTEKYQNVSASALISTNVAQMSQVLEGEKEQFQSMLDQLAADRNQELAWEELSSRLQHSQQLHVKDCQISLNIMAENLLEIITNVRTLCESVKCKEELLYQHVLTLVEDLCHITQCCYTHSSKVANEIKWKLLESIQMLDNFVNHAIAHVQATGETPKLKKCKPLPTPHILSSPCSREIANRVNNIPEKFEHIVCNPKILLHRRSKNASKANNESDDYTASDSEVTTCGKKNSFASLSKAQSLPNLRPL